MSRNKGRTRFRCPALTGTDLFQVVGTAWGGFSARATLTAAADTAFDTDTAMTLANVAAKVDNRAGHGG